MRLELSHFQTELSLFQAAFSLFQVVAMGFPKAIILAPIAK
jgi:hypothetical protein